MRKATVKKLLAGLAAALLLAAAGCGSGARQSVPAPDDSLQKVLDKGELVIGLDVEFPPMGFVNDAGEIVGFDVDLAQAACDRLGLRLVTKPMDWNTKEEILNSGEIDCIWSGMSFTPARAEAMNLSEQYMHNELIFLIPRDSDARTPQDLRGKSVGLQPCTSEQDALEAADFYDDVTVVYGKDYMSLMKQMEKGELDAVFTDSLFAYYYIYANGESFYVLSDSFGEDGYVIGFRKSDQTLRDRVQEVLNEMGADGTLSEISRKWFGTDITIVE